MFCRFGGGGIAAWQLTRISNRGGWKRARVALLREQHARGHCEQRLDRFIESPRIRESHRTVWLDLFLFRRFAREYTSPKAAVLLARHRRVRHDEGDSAAHAQVKSHAPREEVGREILVRRDLRTSP